MNGVIGPIAWWHTEEFSKTTKGLQETWSFSPVGLGKPPHDWVLMDYTARRKGRVVASWEMDDDKDYPEFPADIEAKARKRLAKIKMKPGPGDD